MNYLSRSVTIVYSKVFKSSDFVLLLLSFASCLGVLQYDCIRSFSFSLLLPYLKTQLTEINKWNYKNWGTLETQSLSVRQVFEELVSTYITYTLVSSRDRTSYFDVINNCIYERS